MFLIKLNPRIPKDMDLYKIKFNYNQAQIPCHIFQLMFINLQIENTNLKLKILSRCHATYNKIKESDLTFNVDDF